MIIDPVNRDEWQERAPMPSLASELLGAWTIAAIVLVLFLALPVI